MTISAFIGALFRAHTQEVYEVDLITLLQASFHFQSYLDQLKNPSLQTPEILLIRGLLQLSSESWIKTKSLLCKVVTTGLKMVKPTSSDEKQGWQDALPISSPRLPLGRIFTPEDQANFRQDWNKLIADLPKAEDHYLTLWRWVRKFHRQTQNWGLGRTEYCQTQIKTSFAPWKSDLDLSAQTPSEQLEDDFFTTPFTHPSIWAHFQGLSWVTDILDRVDEQMTADLQCLTNQGEIKNKKTQTAHSTRVEALVARQKDLHRMKVVQAGGSDPYQQYRYWKQRYETLKQQHPEF